MTQMFRSFAIRNYRIWFVGFLLSNVGGWMQATAQDWIVLTELTDNDATAVGFTMALQFGPQLLLVPISGWVIDRLPRRTILFWTQSALMLLAFGLGILVLSGNAVLWHVLVFAFMLGCTNAIDAPARQTFVSDLVPAEDMSNAVALNSASFNAARLLGPAVAGGLIVAIGSGWVFVVNAATFIAMIIALSLLRVGRRRTSKRRATAGTNGLTEGFRYVGSRSDLIVTLVVVGIVSAFALNVPIFSSTMAVEFGRGAGEYGAISSVLAIGSLAGALLSARRPTARFRVAAAACGMLGVSLAITSIMPTFETYTIMQIAVGYSMVTMLTTANAYVQSTTPREVRGRVMTIYMAVLLGATPIGAPMTGRIADLFGPRAAIAIAGTMTVVASGVAIVWMVRARGLHLERDGWRVHPLADQTTQLPILGDDVAHDEAGLSRVPETAPIALPKVGRTDPDRERDTRHAETRAE